MALDDIDEPADPLEPDWLNGAPEGPLPESPAPVVCWRCGRTEVPLDGRCPHCAARVVDELPSIEGATSAPSRNPTPLPFVLFVYTLFLLTSVIWGWVILADRGRMTNDEVLQGTLVVEVIDTVLVLAALAVAGRFPFPERSARARMIAWLVGVPALALLLGLNLAYGIAIREYVKPPDFLMPPAPPITLFTVAIICLQPAIVEELFFRYLALGVLTRATCTATAIWISAVMFAMAHIYNPLGLPYLFVAGVVFGIARVYGGLLLPMVMHFFHNLAVIAFEVMK